MHRHNREHIIYMKRMWNTRVILYHHRWATRYGICDLQRGDPFTWRGGVMANGERGNSAWLYNSLDYDVAVLTIERIGRYRMELGRGSKEGEKGGTKEFSFYIRAREKILKERYIFYTVNALFKRSRLRNM